MSTTINNYDTLSNGASSHLYNRLNGKEATVNTATVVENSEGESVNVSISPEARKTLERIDAITNDLRLIEAQFGEVAFSTADKERVTEIANKLDKLHGYNTAETSESYLFLGSEARPKADALFENLNSLLNSADITSEIQIEIDAIVEELDTLLAEENMHATHTLQGLGNTKLQEVSQLFINLASVTQGIENDNLTESQLQNAKDISINIDNMLNEFAPKAQTKIITNVEKNEVNALLQELDTMLEKNSQQGVSQKMFEMTQQTSLSFLQMISGKKSTTADIFSSSSSGNTHTSSSRSMIEAQRMIDAYSSNQT